MTSKNTSASIDPYSFCISVRRVQIGEDRLFKGTVAELPNVASFEKTADEAYNVAIEAIESLYESAIEDGRPFPVPYSQTEPTEHSGRLTLRMPKWLHAQLDGQAEADGISLNQYLITILSASGSINALVREASKQIANYSISPSVRVSRGVVGVAAYGGLIGEFNPQVFLAGTAGVNVYKQNEDLARLTMSLHGVEVEVEEAKSTSPTTLTISEFGNRHFIYGNA